MTAETRPIRSDELARVWPVVRSAHLMGSEREFASFHEAGPWRVRVSDRGDVIVLEAWRDRLDVLAIRAACAPVSRIADLVDAAVATARSRGFGRVMSPLLEEDVAAAYSGCGMRDLESLVAFTVVAGGVEREQGAPSHTTDAATLGDVAMLERIDDECFIEFWRHSAAEFATMLADDHVMVVRDAAGAAVGYAASTLLGSTVTVSKLAVAPNARRTGVAIALLREADEWTIRSGALGLSLCTQEDNVAGRAAYEAAGFRRNAQLYRLLIRQA